MEHHNSALPGGGIPLMTFFIAMLVCGVAAWMLTGDDDDTPSSPPQAAKISPQKLNTQQLLNDFEEGLNQLEAAREAYLAPFQVPDLRQGAEDSLRNLFTRGCNSDIQSWDLEPAQHNIQMLRASLHLPDSAALVCFVDLLSTMHRTLPYFERLEASRDGDFIRFDMEGAFYGCNTPLLPKELHETYPRLSTIQVEEDHQLKALEETTLNRVELLDVYHDELLLTQHRSLVARRDAFLEPYFLDKALSGCESSVEVTKQTAALMRQGERDAIQFHGLRIVADEPITLQARAPKGVQLQQPEYSTLSWDIQLDTEPHPKVTNHVILDTPPSFHRHEPSPELEPDEMLLHAVDAPAHLLQRMVTGVRDWTHAVHSKPTRRTLKAQGQQSAVLHAVNGGVAPKPDTWPPPSQTPLVRLRTAGASIEEVLAALNSLSSEPRVLDSSVKPMRRDIVLSEVTLSQAFHAVERAYNVKLRQTATSPSVPVWVPEQKLALFHTYTERLRVLVEPAHEPPIGIIQTLDGSILRVKGSDTIVFHAAQGCIKPGQFMNKICFRDPLPDGFILPPPHARLAATVVGGEEDMALFEHPDGDWSFHPYKPRGGCSRIPPDATHVGPGHVQRVTSGWVFNGHYGSRRHVAILNWRMTTKH